MTTKTTKTTKTPSKGAQKGLKERQDAAYKTLVNAAVETDTLRARIRKNLTGLVYAHRDAPSADSQASLNLLAALWNVTPNSYNTDLKSALMKDLKQEGSQPRLDEFFHYHQLDVANAIAHNKEQARRVINEVAGDLLTGIDSTQPTFKYTTGQISDLLPGFWDKNFPILTNMAWTLHDRQNGSSRGVPDLSDILDMYCASLVQYFTLHGIANFLKNVNVFALDKIEILILATDGDKKILAKRCHLFGPEDTCTNSITDSIKGQAQLRYLIDNEVDIDLEDEDDELFESYEYVTEWDVESICRPIPLASVPKSVRIIRDVKTTHGNQDFPVLVDFEMLSLVDTLFAERGHIGFAIINREPVLCQKVLTDSESLEFAAALHEVLAEKPDRIGTMPVKGRKLRAKKPAGAPQEGAKKTQSRREMIDILARNDIKSRSELKTMSYDAVWNLYHEYKSGALDI